MDERRQQLGRDHQKKDDLVFRFFRESMEDIGSVFAMDDKKRNYTSERVQLICVFTFVDVIASYWFEYLGRNGTQRERFLEWVQRHCLTEGNPEYAGTDFAHLTPENLYAFRSSMVHFFGIAGLEGDYKLTIATNRIADDLIEKWKRGFRERGEQVLIVKPKKLHNLILKVRLRCLTSGEQLLTRRKTTKRENGNTLRALTGFIKKFNWKVH